MPHIVEYIADKSTGFMATKRIIKASSEII